MITNRALRLTLFIGLTIILCIILAFGSFYTYWNAASPDKTCASCHEIGQSVNSFGKSPHRTMHCKECHGTALSNGVHSFKEKAMMVVNHIKAKHVENIRLSENQLLDMIPNCKGCHENEYAKWTSGGHSIDYQNVFLNTKHNSTEQINFDCLRCHGMFFKGTVEDIVTPLNVTGPWKLIQTDHATRPAIPCMACHQIHMEGQPQVRPDYSQPDSIFYERQNFLAGVSFYDRHEKTYFSVSNLPELKLWLGDKKIKVSDDPLMRNCIQCHAPDSRHQAGTSDDRTPRGVHEGLSCNDCHESHSNAAGKSCTKCHPAISNCKLDVKTMNTSYFDSKSPNDIHTVACLDCHKEVKRINTKK